MFDYDHPMTRYAELHCHTNFSFLDGASHPMSWLLALSNWGIQPWL